MKLTLKACRVNKGLTQKEASKRLGISETMLRYYEQGKNFPDVPIIQAMEKLYEVSYDNIIFLPK